jgi:hypothetical protein
MVEGITVYYTANLEVKAGDPHIGIKLKKLLFLGWLELVGARAIVTFN